MLAPGVKTVPLCLSLLFVLGTVASVQAQGLVVNAQIGSQPAGGSLFDYSLTLNNGAGSGGSIETFWFSWTPGMDYLPSRPTTVQAPAGWTYSIQGGPYSYYGYTYNDGYSIEFTSSTAPVMPGSSIHFGFASPDSPSTVAGNSSIYPGTAVLTSYVYNGVGGGSLGSEFLVQPVPEPTALALLTVGLALVSSTNRQIRPRGHAERRAGKC
jgi:hypothetical protein